MLKRHLSKRLTYRTGVSPTPRRNKVWAASLAQEARKAVADKISSGSYQLEERPCPACDSNELDIIADVERHGLYFPMAICRRCGLVHANPVMRDADFRDFYTRHFRRLYNAREGMPSLEMLQKKKNSNLTQIKRIVNRAPVVQELIASGGTILDVGCGGGNFTWAWQERGLKATGIDLNGEYQDIGRQQGLDLHAANLEEFTKHRKFDAIVYHHVLEHIRDPLKELRIVNEALNASGLLIVVVPGLFNAPNKYLGDLRDYFHIAHTTAFTAETLTFVAARAGFECLHSDQHVYAVYRKTNAIPAVPADPDPEHYEDAMRFMIRMEKRFGSEAHLYSLLDRASEKHAKSKRRKKATA